MNEEMKLILEFDDLHFDKDVDCISMIDELVREYPKILLNFFVPAMYGDRPIFLDKEWCERIAGHIKNNNVRVGIHGAFHTTEEFKCSYEAAISKLKLAETTLGGAGIPYLKCFRGPHWGINEESVQALIDCGYTHLYSHLSYEKLHRQFEDRIKIVIYNWNLKTEFKASNMEHYHHKYIVGHGHTSPHAQLNCGNSIFDVVPNIRKVLNEYSVRFLQLDEAT